MAWALVVAQFGLLLILVLLPTGSLWATGVLTWVLGGVLVITGISLVAIAGFGLGRSLSALPIPKSDGELVTDGLYRFARHPIYTGVLITACGLLLSGASLGHLFAAAALSVVLVTKAHFEEKLLAQRYSTYGAYARATGRFFPRLPRRA